MVPSSQVEFNPSNGTAFDGGAPGKTDNIGKCTGGILRRYLHDEPNGNNGPQYNGDNGNHREHFGQSKPLIMPELRKTHHEFCFPA